MIEVGQVIQQGCITMVGGIGVGLVVSITERVVMYIYRRMTAIMQE